jgi:hypothetical protein
VQFADFAAGRWAQTPARAPAPVPAPSIAYAELRDTVRRLREQHEFDAQHMREQLTRIRNDRARMLLTRSRIADDVLKRRRPPSS